ncbi:MAG: RecX family transcriptional regulator [Bacteroidaceae bacterium]|nr:RecX family transcriptional regulator [Bacteroidaceae bacterium]
MGKEKTGQLTKEEALGKAASLCSQSEHCIYQIEEKLFSWGISDKDAEGIVSRLVEEKYIDNRRFARAYCHDKFCYNHWGRMKIRQMLRHLRLADEEIAEGMSTIPDEDYSEKLNDVLRAKDRTLKDTDKYLRKGKLVRHLLSRGFETELAVDAVDTYLSQNSL